VKVWIFKGEVFDKAELAQPAVEGEAQAAAPGVTAPAAATEAPAQA
jgi:ribosomal protein S3